jgi:hypothetical protein
MITVPKCYSTAVLQTPSLMGGCLGAVHKQERAGRWLAQEGLKKIESYYIIRRMY